MQVEEALTLLGHGWSVIPCRARSKFPLEEWEVYKDRLPTEVEVRRWWEKHPNANAAIVCGKVSGLVVVDIDVDKGGRIEDIEEATDRISRTGGGGWHLFYKHPGGLVGNRVGVRPGIDIRGDGGYVIAPPSVHESGKAYTWMSEGDMGPCPEWVTSTNGDEHVPSGEQWLTSMLERGVAEGGRNDALARLTGYFASKAIPDDVVYSTMTEWAKTHLHPPLSEHEVDTTIRSVCKTENAKVARRTSRIMVVDDDTGKTVERPFALSLREFGLRYGSEEITWLCKGWLPSRTIAMMAAPPESMKSWLLLDLAVSVASGKPFLGAVETMETGPVLLVQQEDSHAQVAERLATIILGKYGCPKATGDSSPALPDPPIVIHPWRELRFEKGSTSVGDLEEAIKKYRPRLVIIDPLYSAISTEEYGRGAIEYLKVLKGWRDKYRVAFILAHHTKKSADSWNRQEAWGSQFLNAFIEAGLQVRRVEGKPHVLVRPHFKDFQAGPPQHVEFDIDTSLMDHKYGITVRDATEGELEAAVSKKQEKAKVDHGKRYVEWLVEHGPANVKDIAEGLTLDPHNVRRALKGLQKNNRVFEEDSTIKGEKPKWAAIDF